MILILSFSQLEETTNEIISWLDYYGGKYIRVNGKDFINNVKIKNGNIQYGEVNFDSVNVCYYRRFYERTLHKIFTNDTSLKLNSDFFELSLSLRNEHAKIIDFLWKKLQNKIWFSNPLIELQINKIEVLELANNVGLNIPDYLITSKKNDLILFCEEHVNVITKAISDFGFFNLDNKKYNFLTKKVNEDILKELPNVFYTSFFQKQIIKEYEIRTFFFNNIFYSICILSQQNKKTEIDSRNYDYSNPNREVPYELPKTICVKLKKMFNELNITSCSVDIIKEKNSNSYYFLEINPVGQFQNVSRVGNYYIEKEIAKKLIKLDYVKKS